MRPMALLQRACAALVLAALAAHAAAQQSAPDAADNAAAQERLYQDALQSIAEGRRGDASRELRRLIENEPLHAGAWLDLALIQCALGHADEAEHMFATIETRFAPAVSTPGWETMLRLIAEAREAGCDHWQPASSYSLSTARGVDQNVNQGALNSVYITNGPDGPSEHELSADFRPMHDQYTIATGDYSREISANGGIGFAQFALRRNDRLHQYDSGAAFAGLELPWQLGHWNVRTAATGGMITLGGRLYQRQAQMQLRIQPPLPLPPALRLNVVLGATYNNFLTLTNFNANVFEARTQLVWRKPEQYASLSLGRLDDRALAQRPGGNRHGWYGGAVLRQRLAGSVAAELALNRQQWDSGAAYVPGLIEEVRAQRSRSARAALIYTLDKHQSIQLEARVVRNRENISIFQYNNRQLQLSWQWQGP